MENLKNLDLQPISFETLNSQNYELEFLEATNWRNEIDGTPIKTGNSKLDKLIAETYFDNIPDLRYLVMLDADNERFKLKDFFDNEQLLVSNLSTEEKNRFDAETKEAYADMGERFVCKIYKTGELKFYKYKIRRPSEKEYKRAPKGYKFHPLTGELVELTPDERYERELLSTEASIRRTQATVLEYAKSNKFLYLANLTFDDLIESKRIYNLLEKEYGEEKLIKTLRKLKVKKINIEKKEISLAKIITCRNELGGQKVYKTKTEKEKMKAKMLSIGDPAQERSFANKKIKSWFTVRRNKDNGNPNFKALLFLERGHKNTKRLHYHGLLDETIEDRLRPASTLHVKTRKALLKKYPEDRFFNIGTEWEGKKRVLNTRGDNQVKGIWPYGMANVIRINPEEYIKAINYASKYVRKELETLRLDKHYKLQNKLKQRLKTIRIVKGITTKEMAELLGLTSVRLYIKWENNKQFKLKKDKTKLLPLRIFNESTLKKIAEALGLDKAEFLPLLEEFDKTKFLKSYLKTSNLKKAPKLFMKNSYKEVDANFEIDKAYDYVTYYKAKRKTEEDFRQEEIIKKQKQLERQQKLEEKKQRLLKEQNKTIYIETPFGKMPKMKSR